MTCRQPFLIVLAIAVPNAGGVVGALLYPPDNSWYEEIKKPRLVPPNWVFPIAWTLFYTTMGMASYLVGTDGSGSGGKCLSLFLYFIQLSLNWAWSPLFFGAHNIKASLIDISLLVAAAVLCAFAFFKTNKQAGLLMVPYILWLQFATFLNFRILQLN